MLGGLCRPVPPCGPLWQPLAADWIPYKKHFRRTGVLDLKALCLDAWMLAGLKGFEEVADRWEEGIGRTEDLRNSHTLDALGGRRIFSVGRGGGGSCVCCLNRFSEGLWGFWGPHPTMKIMVPSTRNHNFHISTSTSKKTGNCFH